MKFLLIIFLALTLCLTSCAHMPKQPYAEQSSSQLAESFLKAEETSSITASGKPQESSHIDKPSSFKTEHDENSLEGKIEVAAGKKIYYIAKDDFDGDGTEEAFALTGAKADEWFNTQMNGWFANQNGVQDLGSAGPHSREGNRLEPISVYNLGGGKKCAVLEWENSVTDTRSLIYSVEKGEPVKHDFDTMLFRFDAEGKFGGGFVGLHSTYDAFEESFGEETITTGHTYKPYWYYWNGSEFEKYKGKVITLDELYAYNGAKQAVEQTLKRYNEEFAPEVNGERINDSYKLTNIYIRENGIINVNFGYKTECDNEITASYNYMTFKVTQNTVTLIEHEWGSYLP